MEESTSREKVLKKIRNALISKTDLPYPGIEHESSVFQPIDEGLEINFAEALNKVGGHFIYCENKQEVSEDLKILLDDRRWAEIFAVDPNVTDLLDMAHIPYSSSKEKLKTSQVGITQCEFLIARLGSVMVSSAQLSGRRTFVFPEIHIVIGYTSQLVPDIKDALKELRMRYERKMPSMVTLITGPSRTADIEKTLVMGAHGPKELFVFLVEDLI